MVRIVVHGFVLSVVLASGGLATAQSECDALAGAERERADALMAATYIHDCCDETLDRCLEQQPRCRLATRLADNVCRRVAAGQDDEQIELALKLRARTMLPMAPTAEIDVVDAPMVGDPDAPVTVVEYADARGTHCARMTPGIHDAVVSGPLQGKVRLFVKVFPLRSNPNSKEAGLAFLAAHELGGFWDYVLHAYDHFDEYTVEEQGPWAEQLELDRERFEQLVGEQAIYDDLVASKKEGLEHGVESTPTFFIDGRKYHGEIDVAELVDVLEEAYERAQGLVREP